MFSTFKEKEQHNCCTPQPKGKMECPSCHQEAKGVLAKTFDALVKDDTKAYTDFWSTSIVQKFFMSYEQKQRVIIYL